MKKCLDCDTLVSQGSRCKEHARARKRAQEARRARASNHARGYTREYRANRLTILATAPQCSVALCTTTADTVDHIVPLSRGGTNDLDNLRPMCSFHNTSRGNRHDWSA
ncbi:HNH endonuclease [Parafrankia sp. EUN1f]|uniref:HNH endonuclease n=1 Tax=Parafrankia sp. EUN1f TaxID=102897 RepID=UPI000A07B521|nr:HNH endonuclease signature motif containing protein [Parafrankia sp. EUN1f]